MHAGAYDYRSGAANSGQAHRHNGQQQRFAGQQLNDPQTDQALAQYFSFKPRTNDSNASTLF